jgi:hypothetical protein
MPHPTYRSGSLVAPLVVRFVCIVSSFMNCLLRNSSYDSWNVTVAQQTCTEQLADLMRIGRDTRRPTRLLPKQRWVSGQIQHRRLLLVSYTLIFSSHPSHFSDRSFLTFTALSYEVVLFPSTIMPLHATNNLRIRSYTRYRWANSGLDTVSDTSSMGCDKGVVPV